MEIPLNNTRISLEKFSKQHIPEYYNFFQNNEKLLKLTKTDYAPSLEETAEIQNFWDTSPNMYCFVIKDIISNKLIGDVNLVHYNSMEDNEIELSIMIAFEEDRKKGYGKESLQLAEKFVKEVLKFEILLCKIDKENQDSIIFFKKNGFSFLRDNEIEEEVVLYKNIS
jgi:RimJ/RimL family protein N-acetyltransferase